MKIFLRPLSFVLAAAATFAAAADAPVPGEALRDALPKLYDCHHLFSARIGEGDAVCFEGWGESHKIVQKKGLSLLFLLARLK